jgi:hypothetical protein
LIRDLSLRAFLVLRVGLGYIGEHEAAAALARLKALRARLLEQCLRLRPIHTLAQILISLSLNFDLLLHSVLGLESLQLLCRRAHDVVGRRDELLLSGDR